jgi:hypothetical protein
MFKSFGQIEGHYSRNECGTDEHGVDERQNGDSLPFRNARVALKCSPIAAVVMRATVIAYIRSSPLAFAL